MEKFVEDQYGAARPQNTGDLGKAMRWLRHYGQNQMQYGAIKAGISEGQVLGVALNCVEIDWPNPRQGAAQHRTVEVEANVMVLRRQVRQIQTSADTGEQDALGFGRQGGQTALARSMGGTANRRVVKRGDQRVAVLQAQCNTRGMARVNSGISALKCVPSSATIW